MKPLDTLPPISLSEMDAAKLMNRLDVKYALPARRLADLFDVAAADYRVLEVEGVRAAPYTTLYFDGSDRSCYLQHHNGKRNRYKVRKRRYDSTAAAFLELKIKNSRGRTEKVRRPIDSLSDQLLPEEIAFLEATVADVRCLQPALWTEFRRVTLVHRRCPERVTIDSDVAFRCDERTEAMRGVAVVEVKQLRDDRKTDLRRELRAWHVRPLRVSKYCLGMMLLNPGLKSNRFKPILRALDRVA